MNSKLLFNTTTQNVILLLSYASANGDNVLVFTKTIFYKQNYLPNTKVKYELQLVLKHDFWRFIVQVLSE